jgi:HAE1 family hydrophobic/amphiphilic exporter-1
MVIVGYVSLVRLPLSLMPNLTLPQLTVVTEFEGAAPQDVESLVTRPLEKSVGTVSGVSRVTSTSRRGHSAINVYFQPGTAMDFAAADVREKIDLVREKLPDEVGTPIVEKHNPSDYPIVSVVLFSDNKGIHDLTQYADPLRRELSRIEGVGDVKVLGKPKKEILVNVNPDRLISHSLSIRNVTQTLSQSNLSFKLGEIKQQGQKYLIRGLGEFNRINQIGSVSVSLQEGAPVYLKNLANVQAEKYKNDVIARFRGNRAIVFQVKKKKQGNLVTITERIGNKLEQFRDIYLSSAVSVSMMNKQAGFIRKALGSVRSAVVAGSILAFIVILLFLGNFRDSIIICTAIPVSVFGTFILLYGSGLTLNLMTLGGLALGAGMLIDNSIVVLENINRYYVKSDKSSIDQSIINGVQEVSGAIVASTLTTVAVFVPVALMQNVAARMFKMMALVVAFSLFMSLFVALFLIPALVALYFQLKHGASRFRSNANESPSTESRNQSWLGWAFWRAVYPPYVFVQRGVDTLSCKVDRNVKWVASVNERWLSRLWDKRAHVCVVGFVILLSLAYVFYVTLPFKLFPPMDSSDFIVTMNFPRGMGLENTDDNIELLKSILNDKPYIEEYLLFTGHEVLEDFIRENRIRIQGHLIPASERRATASELMRDLKQTIMPNFPVEVQHRLAFGNPGGQGMALPEPLQVKLKGTNLDVLGTINQRLENRLSANQKLDNVQTDFQRKLSEYQVDINKGMAARFGLTVKRISRTVETALSGRVPTSFDMNNQEVDIRVKMGTPSQVTVDYLRSIPLRTGQGGIIKLSQVVSLDRQPTVAWVKHEDTMRTITLTADILAEQVGKTYRQMKQSLTNLSLPEGYYLEVGGSFPVLTKLNRGIMITALLSVVLVYMTMAGQFNAFFPPFIVIFSVPMAFVGAFMALWISGMGLSVVSSMGFIVLAGIVVNNAILIVDLILQRMADRSLKEACLDAARVRVRPVLMTTLTTIFGLFPLILSTGEASALQRPLAVAVIGGLLFSTVLILFFIPMLFGTFFRE